MRYRQPFVGLFLLIACGPGSAPGSNPTPVPCAVTDTAAGHRIASVFLDGRRIAAGLPARLVQAFPETFELEVDDPPALAAVPVERIDLIQFQRGLDAEREYQLCPGGVAYLITTKPGRRGTLGGQG
jgi:hypothetical protein